MTTVDRTDSLSPEEKARGCIERFVHDPYGTVGSLYDAFTDFTAGKLDDKCPSKYSSVHVPVKCQLIKGNSPECQNLLRFVGVNHSSRLSILTGICSAFGVASVINYTQKINENTRILHIYQETQVESIDHNVAYIRQHLHYTVKQIPATHIITKIMRGIHFLVIIALQPDRHEQIDTLLADFKDAFLNPKQLIELNVREQELLQQIAVMAVYSNMPNFIQIKDMKIIYDTFRELQHDYKQHKRLKYILEPIQPFSPEHIVNESNSFFFEWNKMDELEYYILRRSSEIHSLDRRLNHALPELLQGKCRKELRVIQYELQSLKTFNSDNVALIKNALLDCRKGIDRKQHIQEIINSTGREFQKQKQIILNNIQQLEYKATLLDGFLQDHIEYVDVEDLGITSRFWEHNIVDMLTKGDSNRIICFATDALRNGDLNDWMKCYSEMMDEQRKNPNLTPVYADFTHSTYKPSKIKLHMSPPMHSLPPTTSALVDIKNLPKTSSLEPTEPVDDTINILLLGESGVGKSTFINAFANYLHFHRLDEAQQAKPIVVIPVSFLLTINDDFDEKVIKFGDIDTNEYHNDDGQSVTQSCKCYVFNISNKKKLRIIDTPGFGDTRGCDQDDLNMKNIFSFLNNFDRIHAVCLLFKPEVVRLNQYFRSLCIQLFEYFGDEITDRFVFCFTNARSTFFAPGNTRPLVNAVLSSVCGKRVQCEKTNTFCFDSEAFRYLVAVQANVEFEEAERSEFEQSWLKSTVESKRFRDWLCERQAYRRDVEWKSMEDAKFQIEMLVRPIVETVRNSLRNIILYDSGASIVLSAEAADPSSTICYQCSRKNKSRKVGPFYVLFDHLHNVANRCNSDGEKPAQYRLTYESVNHRVNHSNEQLTHDVSFLCNVAVRLSIFLLNHCSGQYSDPFLIHMRYLIDEESYLNEKETLNDCNRILLHRLNQWRNDYESLLKQWKAGEMCKNLSDAYQLMVDVRKIPTVQLQLNAIKAYQRYIVESDQRVIDIALKQ